MDPIYSVLFVNSNTGYTAGIGNDRILKTTNGGNVWLTQTPGGIYGQFGISFIDENTGCSVGLNASISLTLNGGINWTLLQAHSPDDLLLDVFFVNNNLAFAAGDNGLILRSGNGGFSWDDVSFGNDLLHSIIFITDNVGYVVGTGSNGVILKTTDSGSSWFSQTSGTASALISVSFTDLNTGYICGSQGTVLKTTTGGVLTGFVSNSASLPENFWLQQNYPNPFNPKTIISYQCPILNHVLMKIFNVLGEEVTTLVNKNQSAGNYTIEFDGTNYSSGIYFYSLFSDGIPVDTKRMVILK